MKLVVRPAARRDVVRQIGYYLEEGAREAAERFPTAVQSAFLSIATRPGAGSPRRVTNSKLMGLRSWAVPGFEDIRIYYLTQSKGIRVLRILHGKRDLQEVLGLVEK